MAQDFDNTHEVAASIFDALPDDPFGEGDEEEKPSGTEQQAPAEEEPAEEPSDEVEEDEEDEEAEDEADADDSEDDEDEEEYEEEEESDLQTYTVKVDGEEVEVPLDELQRSYSRIESWTRKTQRLADERRAFEAEQEEVRAERARYAEVLGKYEQEVIAAVPQMPTGNDPQEWMEYQRATLQHEAVQRERAMLQQKQQHDAMRQRAAMEAEEAAKLMEVFPEWADKVVLAEAKENIAKYALGLGFSEDDVNSIQNHRVVVLLKKAMERDEWAKERAKTKKKVKAGPTLRPGKSRPKSSGKKKAYKKATTKRSTLRESGTVKDAAAYLEDALDL
jgi:hypothetical protein